MALFSRIFRGPVPGILVGVGIALAAPIVLVAAASLIRPVAKTAIKGGLIVADKVREMTGKAPEEVSETVEEAKAESATVTAALEETKIEPTTIYPSPEEKS